MVSGNYSSSYSPNYKRNNISFGRAGTTAERQVISELGTQAKDALALLINKKAGDTSGKKMLTSMIAHDAIFPCDKDFNTGIGTFFSEAGQSFVKFAKDLWAIDIVQLGPAGDIVQGNVAPYFAPTRFVGEHLVDLKTITTPEFGKILDKKALNAVAEANKAPNKDTVINYKAILPSFPGEQTPMKKALSTAYDDFMALPEKSELRKAYSKFLKENETDLEKSALHEALSIEHNMDYYPKWQSEFDENLSSGALPKHKVQARIDELTKKYSREMEIHKFTKFIGEEQLKIAKGKSNDYGVLISADNPIGNPFATQWSEKSVFQSGAKLAGWGLPIPDPDKIGTVDKMGPAGKFFYDKCTNLLKKYDAMRMDAAARLKIADVDVNGQVSEVNYGNKLFDILDRAITDVKGPDYDRQKIVYEMLGGKVDIKDPVMKDRVQIEHSFWKHQNDSQGWGSVETYADPKKLDMKPNEFVFGQRTHDEESLIHTAHSDKYSAQKGILEKQMGVKINNPAEFTQASFAEAYTARNNFFNAFDALGMDAVTGKEYNGIPAWSSKIMPDYESHYFTQLQNGYGLNAPDAMAKALRALGHKDSALLTKLDKAAALLREKGVATEAEANKKFGETFSAFN